MELREDVGFNSEMLEDSVAGLDIDNLKWYKNHIIKNLKRLDSITMAFLLNMISESN